MLLNYLILAISSSIDSLGIGITYGIKNTKITVLARLILFIVAFLVSTISIYFGNLLKFIIPDFFVNYIGSIILIFMGFFMCFQSLTSKKKCNSTQNNFQIQETEKIYSLFIKCLGITIKIIKNPSSSDLNNSNVIEAKEALFLSLALSLDSFCIGIGFSMMDNFSLIFPLAISLFQLSFLSLGNFCGKKIYKFSKLPDNIWSLISGILLILIGIIK